MKTYYILSIVFFLTIAISCTTEPTDKKVTNKKELTQNQAKKNDNIIKKNSTNKPVKKTNSKTNNKSKNKQPSYVDQLAKELNLNEFQKKSIAKIRADHFKAKRALKNAKNKKIETQKLNAKLKADFKRLLNPVLYQKKLAFDKKYKQQKRDRK